ncbi:hypothetical protein GQ53DRAFT_847436 [Thozetella sp. PMI_491]|nr:hypothetical protein GQ53DRAFT_847436 [Thozetella sp. PMI_491]
MFFPGTLQEGIATAIQSAKTVVCFVTDGEDESKQWEDELLVHESVKPLLESQAVVLRLEAGSEGEGFLSQLYPIPKKPTLVVIKNADLREYIAAGVSREDFFSRLLKALQPAQPPATPAAPQQAQAVSSQSSAPSATPSTTDSSSGQATPSSSQSAATTDRVPSRMAEQAARVAAQRKKEAEEAKRKLAEEAKAKAMADDSPADREKTESQKHADRVRQQKRDAQAERARILKAIEDDKAARKALQAEREAERRAAAEGEKSAPFSPASQLRPAAGRQSEHCSLQVRLFDGSTIRSKFPAGNTLAKEVRPWVDNARQDGKTPYTFKVLLTPLPNRTIDVTEEGKSLQVLGLTPSSTLILVPVQKSASAYQGGEGGNVVSRAIASILAFFTGIFTLISTFFGTLFSTAGPPQGDSSSATSAERTQARASGRDDQGRIRGFGGGDERRRDQQFYNGNSTNFEPNIDEQDQ